MNTVTTFKALVLTVGLMFAVLALSACGNTFVGVGKDIIEMGESMNKKEETETSLVDLIKPKKDK